MNFWWKLGLIVGTIVIIFLSGVLTEYKWHLAGETKIAYKQVDKAQAGQANIIKFNQQVSALNAKDKCLDTPVPIGLNSLLK